MNLTPLPAVLTEAAGSTGPPSGFVTVPAKPKAVFHASAVLLSRVPRALICALAAAHAVLAAPFASQTFVSWSHMRLVMMLGFSASCCPRAARGSIIWKVNSVAGRPPSPPSNLMVGTQRPKSRPAMVDCWMLPVEAAALDAVAGAAELTAGAAATAELATGAAPHGTR